MYNTYNQADKYWRESWKIIIRDEFKTELKSQINQKGKLKKRERSCIREEKKLES